MAHSRLYPTIAFIAGVLLTLGFKDFYPDLQRRFWRGRKRPPLNDRPPQAGTKLELVDGSADSSGNEPPLNRSEGFKEGIEGSVGNTPMIKIKSLSEETGCEILAKAEVLQHVWIKCLCLIDAQFLNGGGGSPKDRVALNIIQTVNATLD